MHKDLENGLLVLHCVQMISNPGNGRVMEKIGMIYQYSYEEQWQPKDILVIFRMYQLNFDGDQNRVYQKYWNKYPVHFIEKLEDGRISEILAVVRWTRKRAHLTRCSWE